MIRSRIRARGGIIQWFLSSAYKADSVSPSLILDFANNRYAANSSAKNFSDILTFSRASTATYFDANGVLQTSAAVDTPRFDYDPATGTALGLLIEESRTNSFTYSADLANWLAPNGASISSNVITAPDGTQNADLLLEDTSSSYHRVSNTAAVVSGTTYTISAFVKQKNRRYLYIRTDFFTASVNNNICFDLQSGTVIYAAAGWTATITMTANGWYRISITATATSSATKQVYFSLADAPVTTDSIYTYTGNGTSGVYIWGAQCEVGAFPTSYIPTTTASVTRSADSVVNTGSNTIPFSSWYNSAAGTMYADYNCSNDGSTCGVATISDNTTNNIMTMRSLSGQSAGAIVSGGTIVYNIGGFYVEPTNTKQAFAATTNNAIQCSNSNLSVADTTVTMPVSPNRLIIGAGETTGTAIFTGWIKEFRYYNQRITNSELQRITA